jgi:hypothetical protein
MICGKVGHGFNVLNLFLVVHSKEIDEFFDRTQDRGCSTHVTSRERGGSMEQVLQSVLCLLLLIVSVRGSQEHN